MDQLTYWYAVGVLVLAFAAGLAWLAYELRPGPELPPYGRQVVSTDGSTVPLDGSLPKVRAVGRADPYARFVLAPEVYEGRHRPERLAHSWPAAEVRQIGAATGEWAVIDLTGAQWGERYELEAVGGAR